MTLLQKRDAARQQRRLQLFDTTREELRRALREMLPGGKVILFGSITVRGKFNNASDIDLALRKEPAPLSIYAFQASLEERMEREVDVVLLDQTRLADKILREGEQWTL